MGKFVNSVGEFFKFCESNEVRFVDFRFTDMKGTWHHMTYNMKAINEESFKGIILTRAALTVGSRSTSRI